MKKVIIEAIETHKKLLAEYENNCVDIVIAAAEIITDSIKDGGCIYICGSSYFGLFEKELVR